MPIKTNTENPSWTYIFLNAKLPEGDIRRNPWDVGCARIEKPSDIIVFLLFGTSLW
jgi:hypothetical protein